MFISNNTIRFTCGDTKILSNIKMSQNIMTRIVDYTFGSRWLIGELFSLVFSISYSKVQRFKQAVSCSLETQNVISKNLEGNSFIHFIADNVDHNLNNP